MNTGACFGAKLLISRKNTWRILFPMILGALAVLLLLLTNQPAQADAPGVELTLIGDYDTSGYARDVALSGDHAYVTAHDMVVVVDVRDPTNLTYVGEYNTSGLPYSVAVSGDYLYVADMLEGLVVVDISDPTDPTYAGNYNTSGYAVDVALSGDHAYVAVKDVGLVVVDVSDPTDPTYTGEYNTSGWARGVALSDGYAYIAQAHEGLVVVDVSNPTDQTYVGDYNTLGYARDVALSGDYAYVADDWNGLVVVDVSDPTDPTYAGGYDILRYAWGVALSGDYAYVTDYGDGLLVEEINFRPIATIDNISPSIAIEGESISFSGSGLDTDGTVQLYQWESDLDGFLSSSTSFSIASLSLGDHIISFRVQDNEGAWSDWIVAKDTVEVLPPIWQRPWFIWGSLFLMLTIVFIAVYLHHRWPQMKNRTR